MDVLSDILRSMRVRGSVYFCDHLQAPWTMKFDSPNTASFHLVRNGACRVTCGERSERLGAGDLVFVEPRRDHVLSDAALENGETSPGDSALLLCGYFEFETAMLTPLLDALPSLSIIRAEELRKQRWLRSTLDQLSQEYRSQQPGSALAVDRLTEIVFFELIRVNFGRNEQARFVAALRDKRIARALQKLHAQPQLPWTLEKLAGEIGLSRAAFAQRFRELVGQPMFGYLTMLRIDRAKDLLRSSGLPLFDVAERVGYSSDLAFTRTFRKLTGESPTRFRKRHRSADV